MAKIGRRMRFSLLLQVQVDSPTRDREQAALRNAVDQGVLAEELGYDGVWATEHHGLVEYSHSSAPEVLLSFIAARTSTISIGHAVTVTPGRYNHPIRVAERIATLDVLSGGRVRWGSGQSASLTEQGAFEVDRAELTGQWREALEMIPRMWGSELFEWTGEHYRIPPTAIVPKPAQRPHPPIYMACSRPESVILAGELGVGSLNFAAGRDDQLEAKVQAYRAAIANARPLGRQVTNSFCSTPAALVLDDDARAGAIGFRGARYFQESLATYFFSPTRVVGELDIERGPLSPSALASQLLARDGGQLNAVIGDPAAARKSVARFAAAGVNELILVMQMGTVPHEVVCESMRVFAAQVMPEFR
jgi:alkanesulfonate monooxygenase SsuD/methylene tetrahydromethanopterin reductase-like flavin-dependent oxidoreductase (luciferase family)